MSRSTLRLSIVNGHGIKLTTKAGEEINIRCFLDQKPNRISWKIDAEKTVHVDRLFHTGETYKERKSKMESGNGEK